MPVVARKPAENDKPTPNRFHARRGALRLNSFDPETGAFTAIAATNTPVPRSDFFDGDYSEILSLRPSGVRLERLQSGRAPILDSHRGGSARDQIGVVTGARIENNQLIIEGQLSARDDVKPIAADMAAGVIRNVSIGYRVHASAEAKGQGGARVITRTDWEPIELSIVTVAADPQAHIRSAKGNPMRLGRTAEIGDLDEIDEHQDVSTEVDEIIEETGADQNVHTRAETPQRLVTAPQELGLRGLAERNGIDAAVVTDCIARGLNTRQCRGAMLDVLAARSAEVRIDPAHSAGLRPGSGAQGAIDQAISEALYARMSGRAPEGRGQEFMGRSLLEMGAALLEHRGEQVSWRSRDRLAAQIMERAGYGAHTTSDFPVLLASAGNRVLLGAYEAAQTPLKLLAKRRDATDFRALTMVRLSTAPKLLEVNESGEVKYGSRAEAKEGFKLKTFARIFGLTRQAIINDDLGAFSDTNTAWGRAAAETEADQLVSLLTANSGNGLNLDDGNPVYTTARGNKAASGTVIDVANLGLARKALRESKGLDGTTPISVTPKHLVVGAAKETEAEQALTALAATQASNANPFAGKLTLHVEPRLTGNAWRLFADPSELAVIVIAYLNGQSGPLLETQQGWNVLGTEFRCILDFGCGVEDWRGTYLNPGN